MVGPHRPEGTTSVITLGFFVAVGLPLLVLILAIVLPEPRDKL